MKRTGDNMPSNKKPQISHCACYNTRKAARLLAQVYDRALEPSGLKNTQFATLAAVTGSDDRLTITELAARMGVDRTTLTRNLDLMARDGLVRIDAGADARSKRVALTADGSKALQTAIPLWQRVQSAITRSVDWDKLLGDIERRATAVGWDVRRVNPGSAIGKAGESVPDWVIDSLGLPGPELVILTPAGPKSFDP